MPAPHLRMPSAAQNAAKRTAFGLGMVRANLPKPRQIVYYGALGGLAAVGAIEWPVAAAIGAGVWVASRSGWRRPGEPRAGRHEQPGEATPGREAGEVPGEPGEVPGATAQSPEVTGESPQQTRPAKRVAATRTR
jgi:hypothetical protein